MSDADSKKAEESKAELPADECSESDARLGKCMPQVTFTTFILSLASSALVQLGEVPDPESGKVQENLLMAKHTIDVLSMLRDKTKGGLDATESRMLDDLLYELRMKYVMKSK